MALINESAEQFANRMAAGGRWAANRWEEVAKTADQLTNSSTGNALLNNSIVLPDESGKGILLGDATTESFGWRDITSNIEVRGVAATDPDWAQVDATGMYGYKFAVGDKVWMTFHIPHDIASSTVYFHAHWFPNGTNAQPVKWQFDFAYAKGFDQEAFPFGSLTTATAESTGPGVQYQHMVTETTGQTISGLTEPDGLIHCMVTRITNGGTENTDDIFMMTADIHYQSTNIATVNKSPSFYG